ncbi:MAG TPA: metallopeptidase family protein [Candidatus Dormibacteraeota bacterium]|jgi:predicted Zn-dependent protease with MMP-like domain|nr:metallopeptidase family protein [Candidatus Dormibacteraeota bacterium]
MPLFRRRAVADPNDLAGRLEQADAAIEENDPRAALRILESVLKDAAKASPEAVSAQVVRAEALRSLGRLKEAEKAAAQACEWDPEDGPAWYERGLAAYRLARFEDAAAWLEEAATLEPEDAHAWNALGRARVWTGDKDGAKEAFRRANGLDAEHFVVPLRIAAFEFDRIAADVWKSIPQRFKERMDNTIVAVEELPDEEDVEDGGDPDLLGIYTGATALGDDFPERIVLYQRNHENVCANLGELTEEIRRTILHEVGHHFGMDHDELPY